MPITTSTYSGGWCREVKLESRAKTGETSGFLWVIICLVYFLIQFFNIANLNSPGARPRVWNLSLSRRKVSVITQSDSMHSVAEIGESCQKSVSNDDKALDLYCKSELRHRIDSRGMTTQSDCFLLQSSHQMDSNWRKLQGRQHVQ